MLSIIQELVKGNDTVVIPVPLIKVLSPDGALILIEHIKIHTKECRRKLKNPCKIHGAQVPYRVDTNYLIKEFNIPIKSINLVSEVLVSYKLIHNVKDNIWELNVLNILKMVEDIFVFFAVPAKDPIRTSTLREKLSGIVPVKKANTRTLKKNTLEFIEIWNTFPNLKFHTLHKSPRTGSYFYDRQTTYVKRLDDNIGKIVRGKFYTAFTEITPEALRSNKVTITQFKLVTERINRLATPEYSKNPESISKLPIVEVFFKHNPIPIKAGDPTLFKYRYKFLFIHCLLNDPLPITESKQYQVTTEYPMVVHNVEQMLKDNSRYIHNTHNYNTIVRMVNKAVGNIKAEANGSFNNIISRLHVHLSKCMEPNIHVDYLYTAVEYKLLPYLRSILEVRS